MSTIKEVAKLAGVGLGTASRALNGGKNVSPETMEKVLEVSRKLQYKPNKTARSLVKGDYSQPTIGVIFTTAIHPFFYEILRGVYYGLQQSHYNLLVFNMGYDRSNVFNRIPFENLAGILNVSTKMTAEEKKQLKISRIPFVYLDYFEEDVNSIYLDNYMGGGMAGAYLLSKGVKKIAFVGENTHNQQSEKRVSGFMDKLKEQNIEPVCQKLIDIQEEMPFDIYEKESYYLTKEILQNHEIDGIFFYCDEFAYGGLNAIEEWGGPVSIIGYDDTMPSKYLKLTTIRQPAYKLGLEGARQMISLILGADNEILQKCIHPELIVRST